MHMRQMVPPEAYQNIHCQYADKLISHAELFRQRITTLDFNGSHHYYENRIFPLDEEYVSDYVS